MRITKKHRSNSQMHTIPEQPGHVVELDCFCKPDLTIVNGHILVEHREIPKQGSKWCLRIANLGVKLLGRGAK